MLVIEKYIRKGMCDCCIGSVPKRGPLHGKKKMEKWLKKDTKVKYVYKADIHHFFQNVDVSILKQLLRRDFKDPYLLALLDYILDRGSRNTGKGLPIGYYTSQWLSNYYLENLDHFILEKMRVRHYERYVDDIVILDSSKRRLRNVNLFIRDFLSRMKLNLKGNWQIFKKNSRPLDFLGFRFYEKYVTLRKRIIIHMFRVVRRFARQRVKMIRTARSLLSLSGWLKHIDNGYLLYQKCIKPIAPLGLAKKVVSIRDKAWNKLQLANQPV